MPKKTIPHTTGGEKKPPEAAHHGAPEPTGGPPPFPEIVWRGPFAEYRAAMAGTSAGASSSGVASPSTRTSTS